MNVVFEPQRHCVCVLGGTGFVGNHLIARLVRDGHRVRVLTRRRERHRHLQVLHAVELVECDIYSRPALQAGLRGCDLVVNLVGILNEAGRDGSGFRRAHVDLPRLLVEACRHEGVRRLLHMSALGADAVAGVSLYQRTKGEGEDLLHAAGDLQVTSFRPSVIFGPGDSFFNRFARLLHLSPYLFPLACPGSLFAPVYVGDVVECFVRAIDNPATVGHRYELCGPYRYTLAELVQYTARVLGLPRRVVGLPDRLAQWQAKLFERLPGKPFSQDNYLSLQRPSVCNGAFPELFGVQPTAVETVVPFYLGRRDQRGRYDGLRANGGR